MRYGPAMDASKPTHEPHLGAFLGVFTPTVLTILGVIMYLRSGWVVGEVGLWGALTIVVIANLITGVTALSMSALATSMRVGVGGAYYLISRSFGLAIGGAIGIPLYMSQALSVTLYAYGIAEVVAMMWPGAPIPVIAGAVVLLVGAVAARSTEATLKMQLPIMVLIFGSILAMFLGVPWGGELQVPAFRTDSEQGYWAVFAVFFPAVTGILAGVSLSGDLKDPGRAIPLGTLAAVATGFAVYLAVPVALAYSAPPEVLTTHTQIWAEIAGSAWFIVPGMFGAILSSAFGSMLGAPRTLQALASDGLVPLRFAVVNRESGEPITALRFTTLIAFVAVFLGDLNLVASVLTMFFLTTYGMLNLVAGTEALVHDPSYRPRIRVPWWASFAGAAGCTMAMLLISTPAAILAVIIEVMVFWTLRRRAMQATWGDVRTGIWYTAARWALEGLNSAHHDSRNWRPHILMFAHDLSRSLRVLKFANDFGQQRGIVTVTTLLVGDIDDHTTIEEVTLRNRQLLDAKGIVAFPEVACVPDLESGIMTVAQANGYAGLSSNTVLFGWPDRVQGLATLLATTRKLATLEKCTVIARLVDSGHNEPDGRLPIAAVWWKGKASNGDLMLLMAYLLSLSQHWRGLRIVLKSIVKDDAERHDREEELKAMLPDLRIDVELEVIVEPDTPAAQIIIEHSKQASLVFLGLREPLRGEEDAYAEQLFDLVTQLPSTVLVRNAGPFRGNLV